MSVARPNVQEDIGKLRSSRYIIFYDYTDDSISLLSVFLELISVC
jgi:hypothetical protein